MKEGVEVKQPEIGKCVEIHSYKHNKKIHRIWHETMILESSEKVVIGANNKALVIESDGRTWSTREPAICYFYPEYWFNVLCMLRKDGVYYYCNISSPYVYDENAIKYIDYDLDVKVFPNLTYRILDEDEYNKHRGEMQYPESIQTILDHQLGVLIEMIEKRRGPFAPGFVEYWYYVYKNRIQKR